jgi:hypothetical protein
MIMTLEMVRDYLVGWERMLVNLVLRREAGTEETLNQKVSRILGGAGVGYLRPEAVQRQRYR